LRVEAIPKEIVLILHSNSLDPPYSAIEAFPYEYGCEHVFDFDTDEYQVHTASLSGYDTTWYKTPRLSPGPSKTPDEFIETCWLMCVKAYVKCLHYVLGREVALGNEEVGGARYWDSGEFDSRDGENSVLIRVRKRVCYVSVYIVQLL
jgi:hypothetical protein